MDNFRRFGENCSFQHVNNSKSNEMKEMKDYIKSLQASFRQMSKRIKPLSNDCTLRVFGCEICEYQASSNTVLQAHMTRKHNLDKLRLESTSDDCLQRSPPASCQEVLPQYDSDTTLSPSSPLVSLLPPPAPPSFKAKPHSSSMLVNMPQLLPLNQHPFTPKMDNVLFLAVKKCPKLLQEDKLNVSTVNYKGTKQVSPYSKVFVCYPARTKKESSCLYIVILGVL